MNNDLFSDEQRKKEKESREKKLQEEKLEKQREKEAKEQQRKTEREEKGKLSLWICCDQHKLFLFIRIFQRNSANVKKRNENYRRNENGRKKVVR